jgi:serine/threonine-protein kinase
MTPQSQNLRSILDDGPLRIARAIQIVRDIARELAHSHLQGVVHGGIKPANVLVLGAGGITMIEFGAGPALPLSPEQARGEPIDHRCDLFALGALLYEMLAQRAPFPGATPKEVAHSLLHVEPPAPGKLNPLVPPALDAIVMSLLAKEPAARMPGVPVLLRELERLEQELGLDSADAARIEPTLRMPDPAELRDVREPVFRAEPPADEAAEHRRRIIEREVADRRASPRPPAPWPPRSSRIETVTAFVTVLAVLGLGVAGFMYFSTGSSAQKVVAKRIEEARAALTPAAPPPAPAPVPAEPKQLAAAPAPLPQQEVPATTRVAAAQPAVTSPAVEAPKPIATEAPAAEPVVPAKPPSGSGLTIPPSIVPPAPAKPAPPVTKAPTKAPTKPAQLIFAVSPGGEIYIDGNYLATTPPATTFDLEPGMYRVEVRHGSRKPYLTYMTVEPGDVRRITHDFNARPSRPPGG